MAADKSNGYAAPRPWGRALAINWRNVRRLQDWSAHAARKPWAGLPRFCSYYGPIRDHELFAALSVFRGAAYRSGDATRRMFR